VLQVPRSEHLAAARAAMLAEAERDDREEIEQAVKAREPSDDEVCARWWWCCCVCCIVVSVMMREEDNLRLVPVVFAASTWVSRDAGLLEGTRRVP
jgi:hypothetical protein